MQEEQAMDAESNAGDDPVPNDTLDPENRKKTSRSMLSSTSTVPEKLLQRFRIPDQCSISRTVHRDSTLPLFQGRLPWGKFYEGKCLVKKLHRCSDFMSQC